MTTATKEKTENDMLIEEMLSRADKAPEPGTMDRVVSRGDAETPPMVITELKSADYVYIYETATGESSVANRNMLVSLLKIKNKDGTSRFTTQKPSYSPKRGSLKCMLHADVSDRGHYNDLGLPTCGKSNITAPYMVEQHMKKRHPSAWATIEKERTDKERLDDREYQRALYNKLSGQLSSDNPSDRLDAMVHPKMAEVVANNIMAKIAEFKCDTCGNAFTTRIALEGHKRSHK